MRQALGLGKVFFYGDSYGTLFGQAYAVRYPGSLRGLDPRLRLSRRRSLLPDAAAGRAATGCGSPAATRPSAPATRSPASPGSSAASTPPSARPRACSASSCSPGRWRRAPTSASTTGDRRFLAGDPRRLNRLIAPGPAGHGALREFSYGLEIAVECIRLPAALGPGGAGPTSGSASSRPRSRACPKDHFAPFGRREYLLSSAAHLTNCLNWPAPPPGGLEPPVPAGWRAPTSFPTLVLAGQVDDITSPAEARQVQRRFPRSRLYVVPNRGHASSLYFPFRSPAVGAIRHFIASN